MVPKNEFEVENMTVGANLKRLRREKGLTQSQLSTLCNIELNHISKIEMEKSDPKLSTIYKLINGLECSADALLIDSDKLSMDGKLANCLERTKSLPPKAKAVIIELIDSYCGWYGMKKILKEAENQGWPMKGMRVMTGETEGLFKETPDIETLKDN